MEIEDLNLRQLDPKDPQILVVRLPERNLIVTKPLNIHLNKVQIFLSENEEKVMQQISFILSPGLKMVHSWHVSRIIEDRLEMIHGKENNCTWTATTEDIVSLREKIDRVALSRKKRRDKNTKSINNNIVLQSYHHT